MKVTRTTPDVLAALLSQAELDLLYAAVAGRLEDRARLRAVDGRDGVRAVFRVLVSYASPAGREGHFETERREVPDHPDVFDGVETAVDLREARRRRDLREARRPVGDELLDLADALAVAVSAGPADGPNTETSGPPPGTTAAVHYVVEARDRVAPPEGEEDYRRWFPFTDHGLNEFETPGDARKAAATTADWYPVYEYRVVRVTTTREVVGAPESTKEGDRT